MIVAKIFVTIIANLIWYLICVLVGKAVEKTGKNNFTPYQECVLCSLALIGLLIVIFGIATIWLI